MSCDPGGEKRSICGVGGRSIDARLAARALLEGAVERAEQVPSRRGGSGGTRSGPGEVGREERVGERREGTDCGMTWRAAICGGTTGAAARGASMTRSSSASSAPDSRSQSRRICWAAGPGLAFASSSVSRLVSRAAICARIVAMAVEALEQGRRGGRRDRGVLADPGPLGGA